MVNAPCASSVTAPVSRSCIVITAATPDDLSHNLTPRIAPGGPVSTPDTVTVLTGRTATSIPSVSLDGGRRTVNASSVLLADG